MNFNRSSRNFRHLSSGLLALSVLSSYSLGQQNMTFTPSLKSVAVFRDGYGFFVREGEVKLENGWATTSFVPSAIRGTVWVYAVDKGDRIDTVITTHDNTISFTDAKDLKAKLADKIGLVLTVVLKSGQRFEGKLNRLLDDMLLLQVGSAFTAIQYGEISSVSLNGYPIRVKVETANPNKVAKIGFAYLQEGIRWDPSYILELTKASATLTLRASIQNTAENLTNSDLLFVVGSPFIADRGMSDMISLLPPEAIAQKPITAHKADDGKEVARDPEAASNSTVAPTTASISPAEEAGELYYYRKPKFTLAKQDVAMISLLSTTVAIDPSFEWDADGGDVSYLLNVKNPTTQPFTTGTVFVVEDNRPLGQDTIKYTPSGGIAHLKLSRGVGLHVEKTEAEVKRGAPTRIGKTDFISVTLLGKLSVTNNRRSDAEINIAKSVRGRVGDLSDSGKVKDTQILNGEPNPINDLIWTVRVPAGQTKVVTYTVTTYMSAERAGSPPVPSTPDENQ